MLVSRHMSGLRDRTQCMGLYHPSNLCPPCRPPFPCPSLCSLCPPSPCCTPCLPCPGCPPHLPISPFSKTVVIHTSTAWITNKSKFVINPILLLPNAHSLCTYFSALITGTHTKRTAYITNYLLLGAQKARAYNETQEPIRY